MLHDFGPFVALAGFGEIASHFSDESPDELLAHFPRLTLVDVHAALAYYYDNREVIGMPSSYEIHLVRGRLKPSCRPMRITLRDDQFDQVSH